MLIYKTIRKKKKKNLITQIKGNFNCKHKRRKIGIEHVKEKKKVTLK